MDSLFPFDSLIELLLKYPPKILNSHPINPKRRLASLFQEDDYKYRSNPPNFGSHNHQRAQSLSENRLLKSMGTSDLINEIFFETKSEEKIPENPSINILSPIEKEPKQKPFFQSIDDSVHSQSQIEENAANVTDPLKTECGTDPLHLQEIILEATSQNDLINKEEGECTEESKENLRNSSENHRFVSISKTALTVLAKIDESTENEENIESSLKTPAKNCIESNGNPLEKPEQERQICSADEVIVDIQMESSEDQKEFFTFEQKKPENIPPISDEKQVEKKDVDLFIELKKQEKSDEDKKVDGGKFAYNKCVSMPIDENDGKDSKEPPTRDAGGSPTHPIKKRTKLEKSFHINKWGELQTALKKEYNLINQENELRSRLTADIKNKYQKYYKNYLRLRAIKTVLTEDLENPPFEEILYEDTKRILADMAETVQVLLLSLTKQPRKMAKLMFKKKTVPLTNKFERVLETLSRTFFEDLTTEEPYQIGFLRFLDEIIKLELSEFETFASFSAKMLNSSSSLTEHIFSHLISSEQCEMYLKFLLKNPLISVFKTKPNIELDPTQIYKKLINRRKTENSYLKQMTTKQWPSESSFLSPASKKSGSSALDLRRSIINVRNGEENKSDSLANRGNELTKSYDTFYKNAFEERGASSTGVRELFVQQIGDERSQYRMSLTPFLSNSARNFSFFARRTETTLNDFANEDLSLNNEPTLVTTPVTGRGTLKPTDSFRILRTEQNEKSLEVDEVLERNIAEIKSLLNIFLDSIFSTIYNLPLHVRLFLKILEKRISEKFKVSKEELQLVLSNFLFLKWIIPKFSRPIFTGLGFDDGFREKQQKNLILLSGILHKVVKSSHYDSASAEYVCFNEFIEENRVYMREYYEELINIGNSIVELIECETEEDQTPKNEVTIRSVFLSMESIFMICEYISSDFSEFDQEVKDLISNILANEKKNPLFNKLFQVSGYVQLIKNSEIYVCLVDINYPWGPFGGFQELLFTDPSDPDEATQLLSKTVSLLRRVLISIDKVNTVFTLTGHENVHISEILQMYQEKSHIYDYTQLKSTQKIPIETTAKFLNSCIERLERLDPSLTVNNWRKINERMFEQFDDRSCHFQQLLQESKSALTMALENLEKANYQMQVSLDRCRKHQLTCILNEKILKNLKFPVCLTSWQIRKNILDHFSRKLEKKKLSSMESKFLDEELLLMEQSECIHQKMQDAGVHCFILNSKQTVKEARKSLKSKKLGEKEPPAFHCGTVSEFAEALCSLPEVKECLVEGVDKYGINKVLANYMETLEELVSLENAFKLIPRPEKEIVFKEWLRTTLEKIVTRKIYVEIFPKEPTYKDAALYSRIKVLDWIDYTHLEIKPIFRLDTMWAAASQVLRMIDIAITPISKLKSMTEFFCSVTHIIEMALNKKEGAGADDIFPVIIYVILKALPARLPSNMNFIDLFCNQKRMMSNSGYSFIQIKSAIEFLEKLKPEQIHVQQEEFVRIIEERERQYDVFFERRLMEEEYDDLSLLDRI